MTTPRPLPGFSADATLDEIVAGRAIAAGNLTASALRTALGDERVARTVADLRRATTRAFDGTNKLARAMSSPAIVAALADETTDAELAELAALLRSTADSLVRVRGLTAQVAAGDVRFRLPRREG